MVIVIVTYIKDARYEKSKENFMVCIFDEILIQKIKLINEVGGNVVRMGEREREVMYMKDFCRET